MYPNDYCDYLFYTDVYPEGGRIYEKDGSYLSWLLFQRMAARRPNIEFGLSFAFEYVTPGSLEHVADILGGLRSLRIKHYGFLTALTFAGEYRTTLQFIRVLMGSLKYMQGSDPEAKTVLASGVYDYSAKFMPTFETEFRHTANTFVADIFIAIISAGWPSPTGSCDAIPPNSFKTVNMSHATLNNYWFAVSARTNFSKAPVITGLSFEMSALEYVMDEQPMSLQDSIFQQCSSVKETGREALCKHANFTGGPENYVGDPIYAYAAFSNASNVLVVSEYNASLASKFLMAVSAFGELRARTAWLLYNVHNEAPGNDCIEPPFSVLKHFKKALKGAG